MFNDYFNFRKSLTIPFNLYELNEIAALYQDIIDENDNELIKKCLMWEVDLLLINENVMIIENDENRFNNELKNLDKDRYHFYYLAYENSDNLRQKIRYLDFLVDYKNDINKEELIIKLIEDIEEYIRIVNEVNQDMLSVISRYVYLIKKNNFENRYEKGEEAIINLLLSCIESKKCQWAVQLSILLRVLMFNEKGKSICTNIIKSLVNVLDKARQYFKDSNNYKIQRMCINELIEWYKIINNKVVIDNLLVEYGKTFELEADSKVINTLKPNYLKAMYLEKAMVHYFEIGHKEKAKEVKIKLLEGLDEIKNDKKEYDKNFMAKTYSIFENKSSLYSFRLLKQTKHFIPAIDDIKKQAKLLGIDDIDNQYQINLEITYGVFLNYIWNRLFEEGLTEEIILNEIVNWPYMPQDKGIVVEQGFKQFFKEDYISTINILVPHFERIFRQFIDAGSYQSEAYKSFSDLLKDEFVKKHIDNDFLYLIDFILLNNKGYNLTKKVTTGTTPIYMYNKHYALMVIYIYCALASYKWKQE